MSIFINRIFIGIISISIMLSLCSCSYGGYNDSNIYLERDEYNYYPSYVNSQPEVTFRSVNSVRGIPDPNILNVQIENPNSPITVVENNTRSISITTPKNIPVLAETNTNRNFVNITRQQRTDTNTSQDSQDQWIKYTVEDTNETEVTDIDIATGLKVVAEATDKALMSWLGLVEFNDLMSQQNRNMTGINVQDMQDARNYMEENLPKVYNLSDADYEKIGKLEGENNKDFHKKINDIVRDSNNSSNSNETNGPTNFADFVGPLMEIPDTKDTSIADHLDKLNNTVEKTESFVIEAGSDSDTINNVTINDTADNTVTSDTNNAVVNNTDTKDFGGGNYSGSDGTGGDKDGGSGGDNDAGGDNDNDASGGDNDAGGGNDNDASNDKDTDSKTEK